MLGCMWPVGCGLNTRRPGPARLLPGPARLLKHRPWGRVSDCSAPEPCGLPWLVLPQEEEMVSLRLWCSKKGPAPSGKEGRLRRDDTCGL